MRKVIMGIFLTLAMGVGAGQVAEVRVVGTPSSERLPAYWWKYVEWHQQGRMVMGGGVEDE